MNRARAPTGDGFGGPTSGGVDPIPRVAIDVSRGATGTPGVADIEKEMEVSGRIIDLTVTLPLPLGSAPQVMANGDVHPAVRHLSNPLRSLYALRRWPFIPRSRRARLADARPT